MNAEQPDHLKELAKQIFLRALERTTVPAAVQRNLEFQQNILRVGDRAYKLEHYSEICILSVGKAGATLFDAFDDLLGRSLPTRGVVTAPHLPDEKRAGVQYFQGGHPEPNEASLEAATAALSLLKSAAPDALILFLISGGASAMFELPVDDTISLADIKLFNRLLVGCGASISEINCVRKHLSRVKGGRLAAAAGARAKITLLISDVPDGQLDALGSGPSVPDTSSVADCLRILRDFAVDTRLPESIKACVEKGLLETPDATRECFQNAAVEVLLSNSTFLERLSELLSELGYSVQVDNSCDEWPYEAAADHLLSAARTAREQHPRGALLSGGEVAVTLPEKTGVGGRNQQFALYCAAQLKEQGFAILSAGTDGIDGVSPATGAVVDGDTERRGRLQGMEIADHLAAFDAGTYFAKVEDALVTGPTGNNLRDVRLLIWE